MKRPSPSWQRRAFLVFLSQSITLFGSTLSQMAIVWYLTLDTTSGAWVAAAMVCNTLPQCLLSFPGGVWADRYAKKPLILGADGAIAGITLVTLPLVSVGSPPRGLLLLLLVLRSLGAGIQTPAVNALIPQLVPPDDRMQYNGYFASLQGVAQFLAPAVAGLLMTWFPLGAALMADILTALLGMGLFAWVSLPAERDSKPRNASITTIRETLSHQGIRPVLAVYGCFIALTVPSGYLAQLLAARVYGDHYGILTAVELAGFAGMCLGGLVMGHFSGRIGSWRILAGFLALFGGLSAVMGWVDHFPLYLCLMAAFGVALTAVQTTITTLLQEIAPPDGLGKAFGLLSACYAGALPLGMAVFGPMADVIPLPCLMTIAGVLLLGIAGKILGKPPQNMV